MKLGFILCVCVFKQCTSHFKKISTTHSATNLILVNECFSIFQIYNLTMLNFSLSFLILLFFIQRCKKNTEDSYSALLGKILENVDEKV